MRHLLRALGIHPQRYRLLVGLFGQLSERRDMLTQLGGDGVALRTVALMYLFVTGLVSVLFLVTAPPAATYSRSMLGFAAFILVTILLAETGNSLVNPVEGLVLAHQPINGATYIAAKLTHLLRILLYLVPALNAVPAVAGWTLKGAGAWFPLVHIISAFALGLVLALLCCAVYGWLVRLVPTARLKTAGQAVELLPWIAFVLLQPARKWLKGIRIADWLPAQPEARIALACAIGIVAFAAVVLGLRSLSADYLIRVSSIVHGGRPRKHARHTRRSGRAVAWLCDGQAGRAGFEYVSRLMLRDWEFRRQVLPMLASILILVVAVAEGFRTSPFSGKFTAMHIAPHVLGFVMIGVCSLLPYGSQYKAASTFLVVQGSVFGPFARGVFAALWLKGIAIPHGFFLLILSWPWGFRDAVLFVAYSVAVVSAFLSLALRLVDAVPFTRQPNPARSALMMPVFILAAAVIGAAVALQYFVLFRSRAGVTGAAGLLALAAFVLTSASLRAFESAMRYQLSLLSAEVSSIYVEV